MNKILLALIIFMVLGSNPGFAQQGNKGKNCATMEVFERQKRENPGLEKRMEAIERFTKNVIANNNGKGKPVPTEPTEPTEPTPVPAVIKIPIVFHVVWNTPDQNVSDAAIQAQLKVLNDDFRKLNTDINQLPAAFAGREADTEIEFILDRIIRVPTRVNSFTTNDAVKSTKRGGSDAIDPSKFLNFWVCNLGSGLLGYAQFPGGSPSTDGIVCLYSSLPGGTASNYDLGRTATHEVGHWLNLRHIWGDATCGTDYVDDTPTQRTSNSGCPQFPSISCNNNGDMSMNYMDYTYDRCMYMFTYGQKDRMRAIFAAGGPRSSFISSTAPRYATTTSIGANVKAEPSKMASNTVLVYPNPANTEATISITLADLGSAVSLQVMDVRGRIVHSKSWTDTKATFDHTLNLDKMARGIYFVSVHSGNSKKVTKLSVIR